MKIALDKKTHFFTGAAIAGLLVAYGFPVIIAFVTSVFIGLLKEVLDTFGYGTPDKMDFIYTALGAALVLPILCL